jgi:tetratricopeptide (TPR) repeat protein
MGFFRIKRGGLALAALILLQSCETPPDEETLLLYARAQGVYSEGRFVETARMLGTLRSFPPGLVLRGKAEYFSGDLLSAEASLRRALRLRPASAEASVYLIRILRERGKAEEALSLAEALIADDPSDIRALRLAADLFRERGPGGEAAAAALLDRAVEASAETALVFLDRARARWIAGNGGGALEDLRSTRVLLPPDSPLLRAVAGLESRISQEVF